MPIAINSDLIVNVSPIIAPDINKSLLNDDAPTQQNDNWKQQDDDLALPVISYGNREGEHQSSESQIYLDGHSVEADKDNRGDAHNQTRQNLILSMQESSDTHLQQSSSSPYKAAFFQQQQ